MKKEAGEYLGVPDKAKLKVFNLFIPKIQKLIDEEKDVDLQIKLQKQFVFFKSQLYNSLEDYGSYFKNLKENLKLFEFSEHFETLTKFITTDEIWKTHSVTIVEIFFDTLEAQGVETATGNYAMQENYIKAIFSRLDQAVYKEGFDCIKNYKTIESFIDNLAKIDEEKLKNNFLLRYLVIQTKYLQLFYIEKKDKLRSKNYLLLSLHTIKQLVKNTGGSVELAKAEVNELVEQLIDTFAVFYKNTGTLIEELYDLYSDDEYYRLILETKVKKIIEEGHKANNKDLTGNLEYQLMMVELVKNDLYDYDEGKLVELISSLLGKYGEYEKEFYQDKAYEKPEIGDRRNNDNFLYSAVEVLRVIVNLNHRFGLIKNKKVQKNRPSEYYYSY